MTDEARLLAEKYNGVENEAFHADCERLRSGEPLAYVIGWVPFLNCKIYLSPESDCIPPLPSSLRHREFLPEERTGIKAKQFALIPRVETEYWTEKAISVIKKAGSPAPRILDLCAGSGAIGVAVAKAIPRAHITFAEIDPAHLPTIKKNCVQNGIPTDHYRVVASDLFAHVDGRFDCILTNPPYIDPKLDRTEPSVKSFEPAQALYGGKDGMQLIEKIITEARAQLAPSNGQLWIEHEPEQSQAIQNLAEGRGFHATTHTDQYDVERFSILVVE